jgi:hypothetical protein
LRSEQYEKVIGFKREDNQSKHLQALYTEAEVWQALKESKLEDAKGLLDKLSDLWQGYWETEDDETIADVKEAVFALEGIVNIKDSLLKYLNLGDESSALHSVQRLLELEPEDMPDLPCWAQAIEALNQEDYEKAILLISPSDGGSDLAEPGSKYVLQIRRIALDHLENRVNQAKFDNCYESAIRDIEILNRYRPGWEDRLQRCREKKREYEKFQTETRSSLSPQEEMDAYDRWIEAGFSYDTDGRNPAPERNLIKLRLKRSIAWADRLAARQQYAQAISILLDRALPALETPRTRQAFKRLPVPQQNAIKVLSERTKSKIKGYRQRQQEEAKHWINQIKNRGCKPGESIDDFISSVNIFIHKALEINGDNEKAQKAQKALESLQDGRIALKNEVIDEAVEKLTLAERYGWKNLNGWIAPYQELANLQQRIDSLESAPDRADDWIDCIVAYDRTERDIGRLQRYDEERFDRWLNQRLAKLKREVPNRLRRTLRAFDDYLEDWLDNWKRMTVGGNAMAHQVRCQDLLRILKSGREGLHHQYAQKLDVWIGRLKQQCNSDLVQSLLLQAYEHHQSGRSNLAHEVEEEAQQMFEDIPEAGREIAKEKLAPQVVNILCWHWLQAFEDENVRSGLAQVPKQASDHLTSLAEATLSSPGKEASEDLRRILQSKPNPSTLAKHLAQYKPPQAWELLKPIIDDYSYEAAAFEVENENYEDAHTIVDTIESLGLDNSPQSVVEALQLKTQKIWQRSLENAEGEIWIRGIDAAYEDFGQLDKHQVELIRQLFPSPPSDLTRQIDGVIKGERKKDSLAKTLARYPPEAERPILYHRDRVIALIESESYQEALSLLKRINTASDGEQLSRVAQKKIVEHCKRVFESAIRSETGEELAGQLINGLTEIDEHLSDLVRLHTPLNTPDVEKQANQMVNALDEKDGAQFAAAMSSVPIELWEITLRRRVRFAYANRYIEEVERLTNSGIKTLFNWLFKRRRWKRIKKLEIVTKQLKLDSDESYQSGKPI